MRMVAVGKRPALCQDENGRTQDRAVFIVPWRNEPIFCHEACACMATSTAVGPQYPGYTQSGLPELRLHILEEAVRFLARQAVAWRGVSHDGAGWGGKA
ncbi:hypothetical protein AA11826_1859 [Komagataeibacter oboediens DSM 11826]|nr:hypothetical protein AA11826_1859 [Komagataeibacter oboediens DSM 11826]